MAERGDVSIIASLGAGLFAGASGVVVGHPFDTLKTRLQVGRSTPTWNIQQLYRGIKPPLLTAGAIQSINFSLYERFRQQFRSRFLDQNTDLLKIHQSSVFVGGFTSGSIVSIITSPIGFVKVRQQLSSTGIGMLDCAKNVYANFGLRGFYRGYSMMILMETFGRAVYLLTYETVKLGLAQRHVDKSTGTADETTSTSNTFRNRKEFDVLIEQSNTLSYRVIAAASAGCFSWTVIYPCDVVKTRMQLDIGGKLYKSSWDCFRKSWAEGGFSVLYRGISHTLLRAAPTAATILPLYDYSKDLISKHMDNK